MVKTAADIRETYDGRCEIILNNRDPDIVARNVIFMLVAFTFDPDVAAPIMLHTWYSARFTPDIMRSLQSGVIPLLKDVRTKIQAKPAHVLLSKKWSFNKRSLRIVLTKQQWDHLPSYLEVSDNLSATTAQNKRTAVTLAPERIDYLHRRLHAQPPARRICTMKFRQDGILLPFGSSRKEFDTPNP